jgi:hypothetical protein
MLDKQTEFAATYKFAKTIVNIIAPINVTEEMKQKILEEIYTIGWKIIKEDDLNKDKS